MTRIIGGTWTYSGDPTASDVDWVRFKIADTDAADQKLSDQEILAELAENTTRWDAAADCCRRLAAQAPWDSMTTSVGDLSETRSGTAQWYWRLAEALEGEGLALAAPRARAGGISRSDKAARAANTDNVGPRFWRGQFDRGAT